MIDLQTRQEWFKRGLLAAAARLEKNGRECQGWGTTESTRELWKAMASSRIHEAIYLREIATDAEKLRKLMEESR